MLRVEGHEKKIPLGSSLEGSPSLAKSSVIVIFSVKGMAKKLFFVRSSY
jgi:hypothetical protein